MNVEYWIEILHRIIEKITLSFEKSVVKVPEIVPLN